MRSTTANIFGYTDRFSARPGESISFHVSCAGLSSYEAALVRLRHGYTGSAGPGFLETEVPSSIAGTYTGREYVCQPGSFVEIPDPFGLLTNPESFTITAYVYPTLPRNDRASSIGAYHVSQNSAGASSDRQAILGTWSEDVLAGYALVIDEGRPAFLWSEDGIAKSIALSAELTAHHWYRLQVEIPRPAGLIQLKQTPVTNCMNRLSDQAVGLEPEDASAATSRPLAMSEAPFRIGALARRSGERWLAATPFNGKIGGVRITRSTPGSETVAAWHFGRSAREDGLLLWDVIDESLNGLHGRCVNAPIRGVTGHAFTGLVDDFRLVPDEYDAIHFHDDDITDAEWPAAFTLDVPEHLPSGVYAARLTADGVQQHIPFFVGAGQQKNDVAVLLPTATYLAYANDRIAFEADGAEVIVSHTPIIHEEDLTLQSHPEFGRSCYEIHNDGSGVVFGSVRRPIITLQPKHRAWFQSEGIWGLPADLCIVHWLEMMDCDFDVVTDEDLDRGGYELLSEYRLLITGAHPEYVTRQEIDAIDEFTARGGRLMYLGGNGFFATISYDPEQPHLMELRRSDAGTRPHQSPFGERRHTTSGETSGLWRNKGKAPQRLAGVGFSAQGFDRSTYYQRLEDSRDPRAAFMFNGIGESEHIGGFGIMGGGAAGAEIDCYDPALGSPPETLVVATSGPFSDSYLLAAEEVYEMLPGLGGTEQPSVRSDIVFCALDGGGGFFSVGSIAWTAALSRNNYDNNVATLTGNVLTRFLQKDPLDQIII
jgi:N,N-dimethylformamidase